jgi:hypothetical protein
LSLWRVRGSPNLGIISLIRTLITSRAFSEEQGNALTHPVKVSTRIRSNLEVGDPGRWMKSLPVFSWICALPLHSRDRQGSVAGVVVLTDFHIL